MKRKGFTLTEMIIVMGISVILLTYLIISINYSFNITQMYVRHNIKQDAYNQIHINLASLKNAINVFPNYSNSQLWFQMPAKQDNELAIPPQNGEWYYLELQDNMIYKTNVGGEQVIISSSDVYGDNATFDFDKEAQSIRITCDIWHVKEDREKVKPFRSNFIVNLLNPIGTFEEEVPS